MIRSINLITITYTNGQRKNAKASESGLGAGKNKRKVLLGLEKRVGKYLISALHALNLSLSHKKTSLILCV